jgi:uncharacterized repeat protein (TIGR03803 family)
VINLNWVTKACGALLMWTMAAVALPAQTLTTLFSFDQTDGATPFAGLVQATDGNLYGATNAGGASSFCPYTPQGCGTVFKITTSGALTTLYNFCSQTNCTDGDEPEATPVQSTNGNFYGTTAGGGTDTTCNGGFGCGTVFKITPNGTLTTLHSFTGTDGELPVAALVQSTNGDFYGTTYFGGTSASCDAGCGTVFKITPTGTLTTLYNFCSRSGCTDGAYPQGPLVQGANGTFYGTTFVGGANCDGTIFEITSSGTLTTLHSFDGTDGSFPIAGLLQATNGDFYGTTIEGGAHAYYGTVFEITPSGTLTTLHSFDPKDGSYPDALLQATNGDLYGITSLGGAGDNCSRGYGCGTVFKITTSGAFATLYNFCTLTGCTDGDTPIGGLIQDTNGTFYGTTTNGGSTSGGCPRGDCGTVYSLYVGLKPFVETQPTSGAVGTAVNILGSNLTDATSVTFNGTEAAFTVVSKSLITTTVPTGATTGTVQVVRPNGKGSSNVPFRVLP